MVGAFIEKGGEDEGYVDSGGMDGGDSRLPDRMCMLSMSQSRRPLIFFKYEKSVRPGCVQSKEHRHTTCKDVCVLYLYKYKSI